MLFLMVFFDRMASSGNSREMSGVAPNLPCVTEEYFLDMHKTLASLQQSGEECRTSHALM